MRTPTLQYFYLQKPMTSLIIISIISIVCWIGMGDFYTKGEPREASVAVSMIQDNEWILPTVYADEVAFKPPLTHWVMAIFSLPQGEVTPFTSRLPSAIAFICLLCFSFVFFGKNLKAQDAFLACLIMLTSFELHRSAMTARVDMVLTFLIVLGLQRLFRWEERKKLEGFPIAIPIILGFATLVKGPVGIVLPLLVFGIYLLLLKYNFLKIAIKLLPIALASLVLPAVWYVLAYQVGGKEFLDLVYAENFGRFLGSGDLNIRYELGHEEPFWYNFVTLLAGFIPWTILLFISLFGISCSKKIPGLKSIGRSLLNMPKIKLFSLVASVVIVLFYCIPVSKRSVYLMPAYPFIAIFIAQYVTYLIEYRPKIGRAFGAIIGFLACLVLLAGVCAVFHWIDPVEIVSKFTKHERTLNDVAATCGKLKPGFLNITLFAFLAFTIYLLVKNLWRKNNIKVLYTAIAVYMSLFLVLDGVFLPAFKNGISVRTWAKYLEYYYPINDKNLYVMNDLGEYTNMYGMNFYLGNRFHNFEKEQAFEGFFLIGQNDSEKLLQKHGIRYQFELLEEYKNKVRDGEKVLQLYRFRRIAKF